MHLIKNGTSWSDVVASKLDVPMLDGTVEDALIFHEQFRVPPVSKDVLTAIIPHVYSATQDLVAQTLLVLKDGRKLATDGGIVAHEHAPALSTETIGEIDEFLRDSENVDLALQLLFSSRTASSKTQRNANKLSCGQTPNSQM